MLAVEGPEGELRVCLLCLWWKVLRTHEAADLPEARAKVCSQQQTGLAWTQRLTWKEEGRAVGVLRLIFTVKGNMLGEPGMGFR